MIINEEINKAKHTCYDGIILYNILKGWHHL